MLWMLLIQMVTSIRDSTLFAERIEFQKEVTASTLGSTTINVTNINLASNTGTAVAGDINIIDNSNQALDIKDNESTDLYQMQNHY